MLDKLDPGMGHDEWVKVGMALHDWDPLLGLEIWETWSQGGGNYVEDETEKRWRSFTSGDGVTLGTISYMVKEVDFDTEEGIINGYMNRINDANEKEIKLSICPSIRKQTLSPEGLEKLAVKIQRQIRMITATKLPISVCRDMISPKLLAGDRLVPKWCNEWVYVNSHRSYFDIDSRQAHKTEAFNLINTHKVPGGRDGGLMSASAYATITGDIKVLNSVAYLPMTEEAICDVNGSSVMNSFNPKTVPEVAEEYTEEGLEAIRRVKKHIKFVCSTDENVDLLTQWLAHQVQYPGRKILWSPLIQSIPGTGKSFFAVLLRAALGVVNVGTVSPNQVSSDFNEWATNVSVNILEELRVQGHNRYEAVNALKPLITDDMIQINDKGIRPFMTLNTANYICFTNAKDALPLDENDRRWWIIFIPINNLNEFEKRVGEDVKTYFPNLFDAVRRNGAELRKWFLEYDITEEFKNIKQAPMTSHKLMMVATEDASIEGLSEVKDIIQKGGKYFNSECVSTSDLFGEVLFEHPEIDIKTNKQAYILKKLGFQKMPGKIKIDGKGMRIWVSKEMTNNEVRESFEDL
jgi:hypothetical protein